MTDIDIGLKVKKIRKEVLDKRDTGGNEGDEVRARRWKEIKQEEMIRKRKYQQMLDAYNKKRAEESQKAQQTKWQEIAIIFQKLQLVLQVVMEKDAFEFFEQVRREEPTVYKEMFKMIVDPKTIYNVDLYLEAVMKGFGPKKRIQKSRVIETYKKVKNIIPTIKVSRDGNEKELGKVLTGKD